MKLKLATMLLLAFALAPATFAQNDTTQSDSGVKQDTKDAANATGRAAKKTGRKIKKGTKKLVHQGAHGTRKGAAKVEGETKPSPTPRPQQD